MTINLNKEMKMRPHHHTRALTQGHDGIAAFTVDIHIGVCGRCDQNVLCTVKYSDKATDGITQALWNRYTLRVEKTLLQDPRRALGVDCGCYGKFQRQIAHIADSAAAKGM